MNYLGPSLQYQELEIFASVPSHVVGFMIGMSWDQILHNSSFSLTCFLETYELND